MSGAGGRGYSARDAVRVPGLISLARLPLAAAFPFAARSPAWGLAVLGGAAVSDVLDGWWARRFHQETRTGAVLDGWMDKIFAAVVLATLVVDGLITLPDVLVLAAREIGELPLLVWVLVHHSPRHDAPRTANAVGKAATVLQFATVVLALLRVPYLVVAVAATGICGGIAAIVYWYRELSASHARTQGAG
jgi:phosphatidylglycerophosphate synthase